MTAAWSGREVFSMEKRRDRQAVHSTRYFVEIGDGRHKRTFDLYVPDVVFDGLEGPARLFVTIEAPGVKNHALHEHDIAMAVERLCAEAKAK